MKAVKDTRNNKWIYWRYFIIFMLVTNFIGCAANTINLTQPSTLMSEPVYDTYIKENAPREDAFVAVQRVAERYIKTHEWAKAIDIFKKYRPFFPEMRKRFDRIITLLKAEEQEVHIINLGHGVNSSTDEYLPVIAADGKRLYFTSRYRADSPRNEDIYFSDYIREEWRAAENIGQQINTDWNESINSVSTDGNRLIFFGNYLGSYGRGDIFYADKQARGWSKARHFPRPINSDYFDVGGHMTSDGKALLFCSERPGGIGAFHKKDELFHGDAWGNIDIYVVIKEDGGWSEPINLGTQINTPYCEYSPFLHPDGKTLYFSSDGHYGVGRLDVFKAVRLKDDSWTEWSEPVNLGKEINTAGNDWGYNIATGGDLAYFSASDRKGGFGGDDIYAMTLPEEVRPDPVATISGIVTDREGTPLQAIIKWENLSSGKEVGELTSDPEDGTYFITLPLGKNYGYYAEKQGYYPVSENINLEDKAGNALEIREDIELVSIDKLREKGEAVRINNIFFEFNKYELKPESYPELNRLAKFLQSNPEARVEILGHTDSIGTNAFNMRLSQKRAQVVVDYLIHCGCNENKLIARGYGESEPVTSNDTEEGRAMNRRVEFKLIKDE